VPGSDTRNPARKYRPPPCPPPPGGRGSALPRRRLLLPAPPRSPPQPPPHRARWPASSARSGRQNIRWKVHGDDTPHRAAAPGRSHTDRPPAVRSAAAGPGAVRNSTRTFRSAEWNTTADHDNSRNFRCVQFSYDWAWGLVSPLVRSGLSVEQAYHGSRVLGMEQRAAGHQPVSTGLYTQGAGFPIDAAVHLQQGGAAAAFALGIQGG